MFLGSRECASPSFGSTSKIHPARGMQASDIIRKARLAWKRSWPCIVIVSEAWAKYCVITRWRFWVAWKPSGLYNWYSVSFQTLWKFQVWSFQVFLGSNEHASPSFESTSKIHPARRMQASDIISKTCLAWRRSWLCIVIVSEAWARDCVIQC